MFRIRGYLQLIFSLWLLMACWMMNYAVFANGNSPNNANNLDLSSTVQSISGKNLETSNSVTINVGGQNQTIDSASTLTPAQYLAAVQVLTSGQQNLVLNSAGAATGGSFQVTNNNLSNLIIPNGVTGVFNAGINSNLNLTGNLNNSGNLYVISNNQNVSTATLSAYNIINTQGALLTSVLPSTGISGFTNLVSSLNLNLLATNNIINYGNITSSAGLNMTAGNEIINAATNSTMLANISANSTINMLANNIINQGQITSALNNLNIQAINVANSGVLESLKGNINIQNLVSNVLDINNVGGLISAQNSLNIVNTSRSTSAALAINGGVLDANNINLTVRRGSLEINVDDISTNVNVRARYVDFSVNDASSGLNLSGLNRARSTELSFAGEGNVIINNSFNTQGNSVYIDTSGSISILGNINTSNSITGNAGSVTLISGTNINTGNITTTGLGSGSGGDITLKATNSVSTANLNSSGGLSGGDPGQITIISGTNPNDFVSVNEAIANATNGGGLISISTPGAINVSGSLTAINGTVDLSSSSYNISQIDVGSNGQISLNAGNTNEDFVLNLAELAQFANGNIVIGDNGGLNSNIIINSNCINCLGNISSISLNTKGSYIATGTNLVLDPSVSFTINALGGINSGSISGGKNISLITPGALIIDGQITLPNGNLQLTSSSLEIDGPINVSGGVVSILPLANMHIEGDSLSKITSSVLEIGNGGNNQVSISGTADLSKISDQVIINLTNNFSASDSHIKLSDNTLMSIKAAQIDLGKVEGGKELSLFSQNGLNINGDLNMPNAVINLKADLAGTGSNLNLGNGLNIIGKTLDFSTVSGDINSAANLSSTEGSINLASGSQINIQDNSDISSYSNLSLTALKNININKNTNLTAGLAQNFDPFSMHEAIQQALIINPGSILIDSYQNGKGSGSINIGNNVRIAAFGNGDSNTGNLGITSANNINIVNGAELAAIGGDLTLSAGQDINIDGAKLASVSVPQISASEQVETYSGGRLAIMAGAPDTNMQALLGDLSNSRIIGQETFSISKGNTLNNTNTGTLSGSSVLTIIFPENGTKNLNNNTFNLIGGISFIDPPEPNNVNITNSSFNIVGQSLGNGSSLNLPVNNTTANNTSNGNTTGNVGSAGNVGSNLSTNTNIINTSNQSVISNSINSTGSGGLINLSSGSVLNTGNILSTGSFSSSSVSQGDISTNNNSNAQQTNFSNSLGTNSSTLANDTLDENTNKPRPHSSVFCTKPSLLKYQEELVEDSWIIASSSCQSFTFEENDGSLIVGSGPAKFAPTADRTILLKEGKLLIITTDKIHVVRTPIANITIPVNTATIVEVSVKNSGDLSKPSSFVPSVRIASLAGGKSSTTICRNDETLILAAAPGEQLVLADERISDKEFSEFSFPEVSYNKINSWQVEFPGLRGQKMRFDRSEMCQHEPLLQCSMGCVNKVQLQRIEQLIQSMGNADPLLRSSINNIDTNHNTKNESSLDKPNSLAPKNSKLSPVAFINSFLNKPNNLAKDINSTIRTINSNKTQIKYMGKCKVSILSEGHISLEEGEILIFSQKQDIIQTELGQIKILPGTIALISHRDGILKVRNLFERKNCSINTIVKNKKVLGTQVGQELIICHKTMSLKHALADGAVGRRSLHSTDMASGHTSISSEFSLSSLMQNSNLISQIMQSSNHSDREISKKLMKMAVCLSIVTQSHGNYTINP